MSHSHSTTVTTRQGKSDDNGGITAEDVEDLMFAMVEHRYGG